MSSLPAIGIELHVRPDRCGMTVATANLHALGEEVVLTITDHRGPGLIGASTYRWRTARSSRNPLSPNKAAIIPNRLLAGLALARRGIFRQICRSFFGLAADPEIGKGRKSRTLRDLGVKHDQSSRWQRIASSGVGPPQLPGATFVKPVEVPHGRYRPLTAA